jgi:hypothetical protein
MDLNFFADLNVLAILVLLRIANLLGFLCVNLESQEQTQ